MTNSPAQPPVETKAAGPAAEPNASAREPRPEPRDVFRTFVKALERLDPTFAPRGGGRRGPRR